MFRKYFCSPWHTTTIVSDNGPPFQEDEIHQYMSTNGIKHRKITLIWPQANAEAETLMKPLTKCLQTAVIEHKDWKIELQRFLLNYRATLHCTPKVPLATAHCSDETFAQHKVAREAI